MGEVIAALFGIIIGLGVLAYAFSVYREIKALPDGSDKMRKSQRRSPKARWYF